MHLESKRLDLVPFSDRHLDVLHAHWTDPRVRRYLWDDRAISRQEAAETIAFSQASFSRHGFGFWLLHLSASDEPVGFAGLRHFDDAGEIEILYSLDPAHWRQGLATEAAHRVLRFAFEEVGLPEVFAGADPPNVRSFRVMERLGFEPHGQRVLHGVETDYYVVTRKHFLASPADS